MNREQWQVVGVLLGFWVLVLVLVVGAGLVFF